MTDELPDPPKTDNHGFAVMSDADELAEFDPEDFRDKHGQVTDEFGWRNADRKIPIRDALSAIDEYEPYENAIFWATDNGSPVFIGDGEEWGLANASFDELQSTSLVTEVSRSKGEPVHNVKAYGAVGDGETNDREAIQESVDAQQDEGGVVYFPAGIYIYDGDSIRFGDNFYAVGDGMRESVLKVPDGADPAYDGFRPHEDRIGLGAGYNENRVENVYIGHMGFDGNRHNIESTSHPMDSGTAGIRLMNCENAHVEYIYGNSHDGYAVEAKLSRHVRISNSVAEDMGDDGFTATDTRWSAESEYGEGDRQRDTSFISCYAFGNVREGGPAGAGFEIDDGPIDVRVIDCHAVGNIVGFEVHCHSDEVTPEDVKFIGCHARDNEQYGFGCMIPDEIQVNGLQIIGGAAIDNGGEGARLRRVEGVEIDGFHARGNGSHGIFMTDSTDVTIDALIRGNESRGVSMSNCQDVSLRGLIQNNNSTGVAVDHLNSNPSSRISCDAIVRDNGFGGYRIRNGSTNVTVRGQILDNGGNDGIDIDDDCELVVVDALIEGNSGEVDDEGIRSIINGRGSNDGDPTTDGDWTGEADYAGRHNVTIEDTSNDDLYMAVNGSFVQLN